MSTAKERDARSGSAAANSVRPQSLIELNAGIYALAMVLCSFWICFTLLEAGREVTAYVVGVLVILMLFTRVWLVGLIFFGAVGYLYMDEAAVGATIADFGPQDLMFAASVIGFLISSCRYLSLTASVLPYRSNSLRETVTETVAFCRNALSPDQEDEEPVSVREARLETRSKTTIQLDEFATGIFRVLLALILASFLLQLVPYKGVPEILEFGVQLPVLRASTIAWVLVSLAAVFGLVLTPIAWMRHSKLEAGVYLRSTVTKWCFRDLRAIVKRLVRHRRKSLVTNLKRGKPTQVNLLDDTGGVVKARRDGGRLKN